MLYNNITWLTFRLFFCVVIYFFAQFCLAGENDAPPQDGGNGNGEENMFAILDADSDGRISLEEFNVEWHNAPDGLWEQEDQNGDGFISYDEFSGPKGSGPPQGGNGQQGGNGDEDVFSVLDTDQDGVYTFQGVSGDDDDRTWY